MEADATWVLPYNFHQASYYSMEPDDDFQLAQWTTTQEPAVWAHHGLPVQSVTCLQISSAPISSSTEMQLVEYAAAAQQDDDDDDDNDYPIEIAEAAAQEFEIELHNMVSRIHTNPIRVFEKVASEFKVEVDMMRMKMHRYPASIRSISGELIYTNPTTVAIGPYHHGSDNLIPAEKMKHVAAYHCIVESGLSVQEMYDAVVSVAGEARIRYGDTVAGVSDDDFLPMMFFDACFLVQYMLTCTGAGAQMDPALRSYFDANDNDIFRDITQLENQLPWRMVEAVMRFRPVNLTEFVTSLRGCLQDRKDFDEKQPLVMDESFEPAHLLALLRFYIVGRSEDKLHRLPERDAISFSVSTIELAEIGIKLTPNKTTNLVDMGLDMKGSIFPELHMAPLSLDDTRASLLLNMAALELCTTPSFHDADDEESAVCSYLLLLGMIVDREEDVHELRAKRLLQGGGGLSNMDTLKFLTSLHGLRLGSRYVRTMEEIENYKVRRKMRTKVHGFVYRNMKTIVAIISGITAVIGIIGTLKSLKVVN